MYSPSPAYAKPTVAPYVYSKTSVQYVKMPPAYNQPQYALAPAMTYSAPSYSPGPAPAYSAPMTPIYSAPTYAAPKPSN